MRQTQNRLSSRREWLLAAASCAAASGLNAADARAGSYYREYSSCLPAYLSSLAHSAYRKRDHELSLLTNANAIRRRQLWTRETFWQLVGGQPKRTPLNPKSVGRFDRPDYAVEKVVYESRPGLVVSANVYLPKSGQPPYPGVLFQMGHTDLGKAYPPYQKCCQGLAQLGFVVLAFDPMGEGERIAYPDASGVATRLSSSDEEHSRPGKQLLLLGDSATRYQVWDAVRSLDYLASHPLVDPARLGCTGQSGGGTLTMLLACVDDRLKACAVSSGNTENVAGIDFNPPGSTDDAEQDLINSGAAGFDRWDLLYPLAPKPLLLQISEHDFFGTYSPRYVEDGHVEFEKLARVYRTLGSPDRLAWRSTPLPHGLTYQLRLQIYNWFERWLKPAGRSIEEEPPVVVEDARVLRVGSTGNVSHDFGSLRPIDFIKLAAKSASHPRPGAAATPAVPFDSPAPGLRMRQLAVTPLQDARAAAVEVQSVSEVWLPAWLFSPRGPAEKPTVLLALDDRGRNQCAHEDDLYHRLARSGQTVCAADIRCIGDARPEVGRGNPSYTVPHELEEDYAWASLILGKPLLAQRVTDILAFVQALKNENGLAGRPLALAARGSLTVPALFAFAASRDIESLYLAGGLVSFKDLLMTESYNQTLGNFAWNLFRLTDLPQLAAESAPRRIHLAGAVNAAGKPLPIASLRPIYTSANVTFSGAAAWNDAALG